MKAVARSWYHCQNCKLGCMSQVLLEIRGSLRFISRYTIPFTLGPGNISAMAVYDADGEELARKNSTGSTDSLTFSLADDGVDAVLLAWASNQDVQLDYSARRTPLPSTSATSQIPQSTSQPSMGITRVHFVSSGLLFLCVVVIALSMTSLPGL